MRAGHPRPRQSHTALDFGPDRPYSPWRLLAEIVRGISLSMVPSPRRALNVRRRWPDRPTIGALDGERTAMHDLWPIPAKRARLQYRGNTIHNFLDGRGMPPSVSRLPTSGQKRRRPMSRMTTAEASCTFPDCRWHPPVRRRCMWPSLRRGSGEGRRRRRPFRDSDAAASRPQPGWDSSGALRMGERPGLARGGISLSFAFRRSLSPSPADAGGAACPDR